MTNETRHDDIQGDILHVYDDIEEADNELPRWWLATFYAAIFFAAGYWLYYESFKVGDTPVIAYGKAKLAALDKGGDITEPELVALAADPLMVDAGQGIFRKSCSNCHGAKAEGKIGPNLTDEYWLEDGSAVAIYDTIFRGRTTKGMPSWSALGRGQVQQVTAYLLSIRNSKVAGKEPQGQLWQSVEEARPATATDSTEAVRETRNDQLAKPPQG